MADTQSVSHVRLDGIRRIAVVGGGTAGWITASILARSLPGTGITISVIESPDIGIVGVGEATIPPIIDLLNFLSIDLGDFVRHTNATYKLGIKFADWKVIGESFWHPFGTLGVPINRRPFYHAWHRARAEGRSLSLADYCGCAALGEQGKFLFPDPTSGQAASGLRYALHFDAALVGRYLRAYAERLGVQRLERTVVSALRRVNGLIQELKFADGSALQADLYIDCSGFRGVLIEQQLGTGYVDWKTWLPCDRAVAAPTALPATLMPYTLATARSAGWQWRIPLQHRVGNGYVYSSEYCTDTKACDEFLAGLAGAPSAEPRFLRFTPGRRKLFWNHNCVALGLASGFLEPLESTSIHLIVRGVYHLLEHFPNLNFDQSNIDRYNAEVIAEFESVRDFLILHYCTTQRDDAPLWRYSRAVQRPDSLQERIDHYSNTGRIRCGAGELFTDASWFYIFEGMGIQPQSYDPLVDVVPREQFHAAFTRLAESTANMCRSAPPHHSYFSQAPNIKGAQIVGS